MASKPPPPPPCLVIASGSALDAPEDVLVAHQCNCTSRGAAGFARALFERFPEANVYGKGRSLQRKMGQIEVRGRFVALYAQFEAGPPKNSSAASADSPAHRLSAFKHCLRRLALACREEASRRAAQTRRPAEPLVVALPLRVGCERGGGQHEDYLRALHAAACANADCMRLLLCDDARFHAKGGGGDGDDELAASRRLVAALFAGDRRVEDAREG